MTPSLEFDTSTTLLNYFSDDVMEQERAFGNAVFRQSVEYEIVSTEEEDRVLCLYSDTWDLAARLVPLPKQIVS